MVKRSHAGRITPPTVRQTDTQNPHRNDLNAAFESLDIWIDPSPGKAMEPGVEERLDDTDREEQVQRQSGTSHALLPRPPQVSPAISLTDSHWDAAGKKEEPNVQARPFDWPKNVADLGSLQGASKSLSSSQIATLSDQLFQKTRLRVAADDRPTGEKKLTESLLLQTSSLPADPQGKAYALGLISEAENGLLAQDLASDSPTKSESHTYTGVLRSAISNTVEATGSYSEVLLSQNATKPENTPAWDPMQLKGGVCFLTALQ